jgi:hypothetical protein
VRCPTCLICDGKNVIVMTLLPARWGKYFKLPERGVLCLKIN